MKEVQKVNDVCKLLFQDACKNRLQKDREENFLILIAGFSATTRYEL